MRLPLHELAKLFKHMHIYILSAKRINRAC